MIVVCSGVAVKRAEVFDILLPAVWDFKKKIQIRYKTVKTHQNMSMVGGWPGSYVGATGVESAPVTSLLYFLIT